MKKNSAMTKPKGDIEAILSTMDSRPFCKLQEGKTVRVEWRKNRKHERGYEMSNESGLKIRTKLESAKALRLKTGDMGSHSAGDMLKVEDLIGVVVEDVGPNSDFVLVYEAEKIVVPKRADASIRAGQFVRFYHGRVHNLVGEHCGIALEDAGLDAEEIMIDLFPVVSVAECD